MIKNTATMSNESPALSLTILPYTLAVCRLDPSSPLPDWADESRFLSVTRTDEELSIVCEQQLAPTEGQLEPGWQALKVAGPLDFGLTGILASILSPLAESGISVFALSTYDTDYILLKAAHLEQAIAALRASGHRIITG